MWTTPDPTRPMVVEAGAKYYVPPAATPEQNDVSTRSITPTYGSDYYCGRAR